MGRGTGEHLLRSPLSSQADHGLDGPNPLPAAAPLPVNKLGPRIGCIHKVYGPAIQINDIYKVIFTLGRFTEMLQ